MNFGKGSMKTIENKKIKRNRHNQNLESMEQKKIFQFSAEKFCMYYIKRKMGKSNNKEKKWTLY